MYSHPMTVILFLLVLFSHLSVHQTINLDTNFPVKLTPPIRSDDSLFGFSVAADARDPSYPRIFVSAPRGNSSRYGIENTGAIYSCSLPGAGRAMDESVSCSEIDVTSGLGSKTMKAPNGVYYIDDSMTRNMFLGSSITLSPRDKDVVVCGHLWTNEIHYPGYDSLNPSGRCWIFDAETERSKNTLIPFTHLRRQVQDNTYYYSHAAAGFSSAYTSDGSSLLLGSPGFFQWKGTLVAYNSQRLSIGDEMVREKVGTLPYESYLGYSMTVGKFDPYVPAMVIGAPRERYFGAVYLYFITSQEIGQKDKLAQGSHVGEYFGYSVLAVDLNSDGWDDLLVGAPMFTPSAKQRGDRGRVVVFTHTGTRLGNNRYQTVRGDNVAGSRFGSALAKIGDINKDGLEDVAIGAPYESGSGAIYVYCGQKHATHILREEYFQKVLASEVSDGLAGFGLSISAADLDSNGYPDLVVGSYLTDSALILRGQPLGHADASFNFSVTSISTENSEQTCNNGGSEVACFDLSVCLYFSSFRSKNSESVRVLIESDTITTKRGKVYSRVFFEDNGQSEIERTFTIFKDTKTCFPLPKVLVKPDFEDRLTPLEFSVALLDMREKTNVFCADCPIFRGKRNWTDSIFFENGCGTDRKCHSILKMTVSASIQDEQVPDIVNGAFDSVDIIITVENTGELSYGTRVKMETNPALEVYRFDQNCVPKKEADMPGSSIECDIGNPLVNSTSIKISLDIHELDILVNIIDIWVSLSSASELFDGESMTNAYLKLPVVRVASAQVDANQKGNSFYENSLVRKTVEQQSSHFQMVVIATKEDPSPIQNMDVRIKIPALMPSGAPVLISKPKYEILSADDFTCDLSQFDVLDPPKIPPPDRVTERLRERIPRQTSENQTVIISPVLQLNCSNTKCLTITCKTGSLDRKRQRVFIQIEAAINLLTLESEMIGNYTEIEYVAEIEAEVTDTGVLGENRLAQKSYVVLFKERPFSGEVATWILISSSGVGLLLFALVLICLLSTGFFKRKTRDDFERQLLANKSRRT